METPIALLQKLGSEPIEYPLSQLLIRVGRGSECDIRTNPDDRKVSRIHFCLIRRVVKEVTSYALIDGTYESVAPSRNGVFINGERVSVSKLLDHGDRILIGISCEFIYLINGEHTSNPDDTFSGIQSTKG